MSPADEAGRQGQPDGARADDGYRCHDGHLYHADIDASVRKVTLNFLALGGGDALARALAFASTLYLARVLGTGGYGVVALAIAVKLYVIQLADFGVQTSGSRDIAAHAEEWPALASAVMTARLVWGVVVSAATAAVAVAAVPTPDGPVIALMMSAVAVAGASPRWVLVGLESARAPGAARVLAELTMVLGVVTFVRGADDLLRVPWAHLAGEAVGLGLLLVAAVRRGVILRPTWRPDVFRPVFRRALPVMGHALFGLAIYASDLIFVRALLDEVSVGLYAAAFTTVSFVINVGTMYAFSLLPTLTRMGPGTDGERRLFGTAHAQVFAVALPAAVGAFMVRAPLIRTLFGPGYGASAEVLAWLLWTLPIVVTRTVSMAGLVARNRQDLLFRTTLIAAPVNLVLNAALIPPFGLAGAAAGTVLTEALRSGLAVAFAARLGLAWCGPQRLWRPVLSAAVMAAVLSAVPVSDLLGRVAVGAVAFGVTLAFVGGVVVGPGRRLRLVV